MVCSQRTTIFCVIAFQSSFLFNCKLYKPGRIFKILNQDDILDILSVHYYLISNTIASPQTYHYLPSPHSLHLPFLPRLLLSMLFLPTLCLCCSA